MSELLQKSYGEALALLRDIVDRRLLPAGTAQRVRSFLSTDAVPSTGARPSDDHPGPIAPLKGETPRTKAIARKWSLKGGGTNTSDASPEAKELYEHAEQLEGERNAWEEKFNAECTKHDATTARASKAEAAASSNAAPQADVLELPVPAVAAPSSTARKTTDAIIAEFRGESPRGLAIALADHARFLEADVAHWKRMHECAQNANAYRQDALEEVDAAGSARAAPSPLGGFADVIAEYDGITERFDRADPEADFVMRGSDWRSIRDMIEKAALLLERLGKVHADEAYKSVWVINQIHTGPYKGPTYTDELKALADAFADGVATDGHG